MTTVPIQRARFPDPANLFNDMKREDKEFFTELVGALQREIDRRTPSDTASHEVLLMSPDDKVFSVTVTSAGTLLVSPAKKKKVTP